MNKHEYIILGAGPAGLQLGYFFEKNKQDYIILNKGKSVSNFFQMYPMLRTLISFNKVHSIYNDPEINMRWDWNSLLTDDNTLLFKDFSEELYPNADDIQRYLEHYAAKNSLKIRNNTHIIKVNKVTHGYQLNDDKENSYFCERLIIATGVNKPYIPDIKGIEHVKQIYGAFEVDKNSFKGQRVLILGKGNSAFEMADAILDTASLIHLASPGSVRFAWETRFSGDLRANYIKILDAYQLKLLHGMLDCTIKSIKKTNGKYHVNVLYTHADNEEEEIIYDRVINCTGFMFDTSIFSDDIRPELTCKGKIPAMKADYESMVSSDLYFVGTLTQARDFQVSSSSFIAGFRYNTRFLYKLLQSRYHNAPLYSFKLNVSVNAIASAISKRINHSSALWLQFRYLCDCISISSNESVVNYYEEIPMDYLHEQFKNKKIYYLIIDFEWGKCTGDVFAIERHPTSQTAYTNAFLHPILRLYRNKQLLSEHHVLEDLLGMYHVEGETGTAHKRGGLSMEEYHQKQHHIPLVKYINRVLKMVYASEETTT